MKTLCIALLLISQVATAQLGQKRSSPSENSILKRKLYQRNTGMLLGLQKGNSTSLELGAEAHWRKISLRKPHVIGATTNLEYNFGDNVAGYKAGMWMKRGRVNLTYGANVSYFTNFDEGHRFGIGPSVGFRLVGLHFINGYNFLTRYKTDEGETPIEVNKLYMSLRYYFPVDNTFTWDRKTLKKKREKEKEKARRKKEKETLKRSGERKNILDVFKKSNTIYRMIPVSLTGANNVV